MKKLILTTAIASIMLASGCTSIPAEQKGSAGYNEILQFTPLEDKAVLYVYRRIDSDHRGQITTIDIGKEELPTVSDCVIRHIVDGGEFNIEPNGNGLFAIEKELDLSSPNGSVSVIELKHSFRIGIPNVSELFLRSKDDLRRAIEEDNLCVIDGVNL